MKIPSLHRLGKQITTERLAVAVFLAVAFGLWWGMQSRPEVTVVLPGQGWRVRAVCSPEGKYVAVLHDEKRLAVFDTATGTKVWSHVAGEGWHISRQYLRWTRHHQLFFSWTTYYQGMGDVTWQVFGMDVAKGKDFCFRSDQIRARWLDFEVAPDGRTLVFNNAHPQAGGEITVIDVAQGTVRSTYPQGKWLWEGFSPDSTKLLLGLRGKPWPFADGQSCMELQETQTGKTIARMPDVTEMNPLGSVEGHWEYAFSEDGRRLAYGTVLWDTASGKLIHRLNLKEIACSLSPEESQHLVPECVRYVHFDNHNQWLTVVATPGPFPNERPLPDPFEKYKKPDWTLVLLIDLKDYRLIHMSKYACLPVFAENCRYMAVKAKQGEEYGIRIEDLQTAKEIVFLPLENGTQRAQRLDFLDSVCGETGKEIFVFRTFARHKKPPWLLWLLSWRSKPDDYERFDELHFLDPASGRHIDRWVFPPLETQPHFSPAGKQLLLVHETPNAVVLEFYSLPPRRPWFHILGWALVTGVSVEMLGLWRRRKKVVAEDVIQQGQ